MPKKIIALSLALLMLLLAVSCGKKDSDVPEDMHSVTLPGEPFVLYVPNSWSQNVGSGISGAFVSPAEKIMVTARYDTAADPALSPDDYLTRCAEGYATKEGFAITERSPALLGGKDAAKLSYTVTDNGRAMTCFQIAVSHEGGKVSLHGYCPVDRWEIYAEEFQKIVSNFRLCAKTDPQGEELTDKDTPEGWEIASADHIEYRLYVPKTWICHAESGISEAYHPDTGANVTVTSYTPSQSISVQDHFLQCEAEYRATLPGYERTEEPIVRTVSGRAAHTYTYRVTVDGTEIRISQTLFAYNEMIYSFTYTATAQHYDTHLGDVEAMLNAFTLR